MGTVLETFNETTVAATGGTLTFGFAFAVWSASVGFSAIQDSLNVVYRVKETRSYFAARLSAIGVTIFLMVLVTVMLSLLLGADLFARLAYLHTGHPFLAAVAVCIVRGTSWVFIILLLTLFFAVIYYFAPNVKRSQWHWLTPGATFGIVGWIAASIGLRVYVHLFNNYSATYGGLGAVIILLTWFYLTGLMLLLGAEINSEIEAAVAAKRLLQLRQDDPPSTAASVSSTSST
jgi:membrane protein